MFALIYMSQSTDSIFFDECGVRGGLHWALASQTVGFLLPESKKQLIYFVLACKNSAALFDLMLPMAFTAGEGSKRVLISLGSLPGGLLGVCLCVCGYF